MSKKSKLFKTTYHPSLQVGCIVLTTLFFAGIFAIHETYFAVSLLKNFQFKQSSKHAQRAYPIAKTLEVITASSISDIVLWNNFLELSMSLDQTLSVPESKYESSFLNQFNLNQALAASAILKDFNQEALPLLANSLLAQRLIDFSEIAPLLAVQQDLHQVLSYYSQGNHTILVLFQNSEEIRATGGYMGSFAKIELIDGAVTNLDIQDIFEPDGQFTGLIPAPEGVKQYLSSGRGLRLPDANWDPDFPTSAERILSYFALSKTTHLDGVITVNLDVAKDLLLILGPLYVPDFDVTVTAENAAEVARLQRHDFFPGSQQKKHFLSLLFNQINFKLEAISDAQKQQLGKTLLEHLEQRSIQLYAVDPQLEDVLIKYGLSGQVTTQPKLLSRWLEPKKSLELIPDLTTTPFFYLYSVESNTGINKANKHIERTAELALTESTALFTIIFTNQNQPPMTKIANPYLLQADHLAYVNYQRLLLTPSTQVTKISWGEEDVPWKEEIITTKSGEEFKQVGFLLTLKEQQSQTLKVEFALPDSKESTSSRVVIQKQPGVPPYPLTLTTPHYQHQLTLEKDIILDYTSPTL